MDNAMEINRAPQFEKILWLKAVCFAAVAGSTSIAGLFLGSILYETDRPKIITEVTNVIVIGGSTTAMCELISSFVHADMMGMRKYTFLILKTTAASFVAFVAAAVVPAAAAIVTQTVIERIVVVFVVVFGMLFLFSVIISLAGNICFWKCMLMVSLGGTFVGSLSVGLNVFFKLVFRIK